MPFDVEAAKAAGYSDEEIRAYLASRRQEGMGEFEGGVKAPADPQQYGAAGGPARSFLQGATLGWGDELVALGSAAGLKLTGNPAPFWNLYEGVRGSERQKAEQFGDDHPVADIGLKVGGGVAGVLAAPALAGSGRTYSSLAAGGARVGALAGAGNSEADDLGNLAWDTGTGAATGAALGVAIPYAAQQVANAGRYIGNNLAQYGPTGTAWQPPALSASVTQSASPPLIVQQVQAQQQALNGLTGVNSNTGERARLVQRADELGMWLPPGARHNSDTLRRLDASLSSNPLTSAPFDAGKTQNREALTDLLMQRVGQPAGNRTVSPSQWGEAVQSVKDGLDDIGTRIGRVGLPQDLAEQIQQVKATEPFLTLGRTESAGGTDVFTSSSLTGSQLMDLRSRMAKVASDAWRAGNSIKAEAVDGIVDQIDDLIQNAGGAELGRAYAAARRPWRFVKILERNGVFDESSGTVNPAALRQAVAQQSDKAYIRGRDIAGNRGDDLYDAIRVSRLGREIVGDSGTATRLGFLGMLRNPLETTFSLASRPLVNAYATSGGPVTGALLSGPGTAARAAQRGVLASETARKRKRK